MQVFVLALPAKTLSNRRPASSTAFPRETGAHAEHRDRRMRVHVP